MYVLSNILSERFKDLDLTAKFIYAAIVEYVPEYETITDFEVSILNDVDADALISSTSFIDEILIVARKADDVAHFFLVSPYVAFHAKLMQDSPMMRFQMLLSWIGCFQLKLLYTIP